MPNPEESGGNPVTLSLEIAETILDWGDVFDRIAADYFGLAPQIRNRLPVRSPANMIDGSGVDALRSGVRRGL